MIGRRLLAAGALLTLTACGTPVSTPNPRPSATSAAPAPTTSSSSATSTAPTPSTSTAPSRAPVPDVSEDRRFTLDDVAEYDDGLLIEIAGAAADRARKNEKGADGTEGQIVIASVRIENGTEHNVDPRPAKITAI